MKTKICKKCEKEKDISEFWKDNSKKDGLRYLCKECDSRRRTEYFSNNPKKYWCQQTIIGHRKKYKVLFKTEDLLPIAEKTTHCPFCNDPLDWEYGKGYNNNSPTLDRTNNGKVLTLENTQIICRKCNITKYNRTMPEFKQYIKLLYNKFFKKGER